MINHHPSDTDLIRFVEGTLSPVESLFVSAHCDMCLSCREKLSSYTELLADNALGSDRKIDQHISTNLTDVFCKIVSSSDEAPVIQHNHCLSPSVISLNGQDYSVPRSLQKYVTDVGEWRHLLGKIWFCSANIGEGYLAQFIFMEKGGSVPEHKHLGNELTLVLDGEFEDGLSSYDTGDFLKMNGSHSHAPIAITERGCMVFSVIDQPLQFKSGWAKLINPLSHLFFKANA